MPDEQPVYFDPSLPISESLATLPADFKAFLRAAFSVIAKVVASGKISELVTRVSSEGADGRTSISAARAFAAQAGIDVDEAGRLFTAATFSAVG